MRDQCNRRRRLSGFWRQEDGIMAVIMVILLPVFLGVCALVIDMGYSWMTRNQLQATADASALAAAAKLDDITVGDTSIAVAEANALAEANMPQAMHGDVLLDTDIEFGFFSRTNWTYTAGQQPYNAVRATTRRAVANDNELEAFFAKILGKFSFDVNTSAVAVDGKWDDYLSCLHALNPTADKSLYVFGNATINAMGCDIQVDSDSPEAFTAQGSPLIVNVSEDVDPQTGEALPGSINVTGEFNPVGGAYDIQPSEDMINEGASAIGDPWTQLQDDGSYEQLVDWSNVGDIPSVGDKEVDLPNPGEPAWGCAEGANQVQVNVSGTMTWPPDTATSSNTLGGGAYGESWKYCGGVKFTGTGTVNFKPGTYLFQGDFDTAGGVSFGQAGVGGNTFIMNGPDARIDMGGSSGMQLSAPTGGELAGFLWIGDPDQASSADCHLMKGTTGGSSEGINYFPNDCIEFKGTADAGLADVDCSIYIADTFYFNGDVELNINSNCDSYSSSDGLEALNLRLRLTI
jgi:Flp pilus assembly protein TadG